jgi:hypothetical protein
MSLDQREVGSCASYLYFFFGSCLEGDDYLNIFVENLARRCCWRCVKKSEIGIINHVELPAIFPRGSSKRNFRSKKIPQIIRPDRISILASLFLEDGPFNLVTQPSTFASRLRLLPWISANDAHHLFLSKRHID